MKIKGDHEFKSAIKTALQSMPDQWRRFVLIHVGVVEQSNRFAHDKPGRALLNEANYSGVINTQAGLIHLAGHLAWPGGGELFALGNEVKFLYQIGRAECAARIEEQRWYYL